MAVFSMAFRTAVASAAAPTIPVTTVSAVTAKSAVLEARVNPQGEATTYRFEYGTADCSANPCTSVPVPDAGIGSGVGPVSVAKEIGGLQPDTTYHFRVVATNPTATTEGPDTTFTTYAPPAVDTSCANQAFRTGASAILPDCRAYEMVSPVDKNSGDIFARVFGALGHTSLSGSKMTFAAMTAFAEPESAPLFSQYMATRGDDGWSTGAISPPTKYVIPTGFLPPVLPTFKAFTDDLSTGILYHYSKALAPGGLEGWADLYRRDNLDDSYQPLITQEPANFPPPFQSPKFIPEYQGMSADGSHVVFTEVEALAPGAEFKGPDNDNLYEWADGELHLVNVLESGEASAEPASAGTRNEQRRGWGTQSVDNAVSDDGSRIFWSTDAAPSETGYAGPIYVRIDQERTVRVSESVGPGPARFWTASSDGSAALFTLGADANHGNVGNDLYRFDVDTETPTLIAPKVTGVAGAADDLSRIYFVSKASLEGGAVEGDANLYVHGEGGTTFIAALMEDEGLGTRSGAAPVTPVSADPTAHTSIVAPDGRHLAFVSRASLTGYDNADAASGMPANEVFHYDADSQTLSCVSCNPSGARPHARKGQDSFAPYEAAAISPQIGWYDYQPRSLSDDGRRVFFDSFDALVPEDTNGVQDVYEWTEQGAGGCQRPDGCISLISTGKSPEPSQFVDATPSGNDVFFGTESSLLPQDPGLVDIYDARVNGGLPPPPPPPPACQGDACQNVPPGPTTATPASANFRGAGNLRAARNCNAAARRAAKLERRARRLRRRAARTTRTQQRKRLRRRSARLLRQSKRPGRAAARCRRSNRGGSR